MATIVSAIMSFCVTVPLAAIFCVVLKYNLKGLVGAITIGYSTTGMILAYILVTSDWEHISRTIREYNEAENISVSGGGSSDESSSSSSSSSSTCSDGNDGVGLGREFGDDEDRAVITEQAQSPERIVVLDLSGKI